MGGGGNCAVDTGVSKQSNAGRKETMVGSSEVEVGHSITMVTVTLFARCFPKTSNVFVSRFTWCKPILHSSLDRTLGILLLKLIVN